MNSNIDYGRIKFYLCVTISLPSPISVMFPLFFLITFACGKFFPAEVIVGKFKSVYCITTR